jgi:hypothetical protein
VTGTSIARIVVALAEPPDMAPSANADNGQDPTGAFADVVGQIPVLPHQPDYGTAANDSAFPWWM